ncbi:dynamin family protein [Actinophytocola oryzae]|uniref:50S ribosome-binding GTPase n=1 Tax=Actinophytocola oryzae TaxID=502181 RepID=A0A4R7VEY9_9PSEU|nr:dynamin family protein [Actinophytocola oryzae]TDV47786.1 50S ribosome-binding GTPase [Actinophytocola oryzae]
MSVLTEAVRGVLGRAVDVFAAAPEVAEALRAQLDRLDEPLRVAIAGKVKAGKSTLLNGLVGELIAPTDAGECTRVVTWYRDGPTPRVVSYPDSGPPEPLAVHRSAEGLSVRLRGVPAERLRRLVVDWPSQSLRDMTLIDTPGIASTSTATSRRTLTLLTPEEDGPAEADAVVYLMRHLHVADAEFLESFRDQGVARASAVNTIAVVSRADEVGGGRVDAMLSARRIARRYRTSPALRGLCQTVLPVAGLLAATGKTLRQHEFATLAALAGSPREEMDDVLLSTSRFLRSSRVPALAALSTEDRHALLGRFGLYGLRLSMMHVRQGCHDAGALAAELLRGSGIAELREVLHARFTERRDLLKARTGLLAVERVLRADVPGTDPDAVARLAAEVERISSGAHEFVELRLLSSLRSGDVALPESDAGVAERLLGGEGVAVSRRLALTPDTPAAQARRVALAELDGWRRRAENPFASREEVRVYRAVARSCEGIVAGLAAVSV